MLAAVPEVRATANLRKELTSAAEGFRKLLQERGEESIAVGQFIAPAQLATTAGPGISKMLTEELQKLASR